MDERQCCSECEDEQETEETRDNLKSENHSCDLNNLDNIPISFEKESQDLREKSQISHHNEVHRDMSQSHHKAVDFPTVTPDYETIEELQIKEQPNLNNFLALQSVIKDNKLPTESPHLNSQSVTTENETVNEEKQLLNRYIATPKDLTFQQQLNVYCNPILNMDETPFQDKATRHKFIRKVQIIHFFILLVTIGGVALFDFLPNLHKEANTSSTIIEGGTVIEAEASHTHSIYISVFLIPFWIALVLMILLSIVFGCVPSIARIFPCNIIYLVVFVIIQIVCFASFDVYFYRYAAITGLIIAALVLIIIMLISRQSKWDITSCSFLPFVGVVALLLATAYFFIIILMKNSYEFYIIFSGVGAAIYCMLHIFMIQIIMAYKKYQIGAEDYLPLN
ncbi:protein lifeguard 3-like isoform X2 [Agrilus planipennis]|uniref:Protein lifeguard 3-like isoform X2 n=1 Tax=Agrilus planipennis TaxID=224129 RepID=A0A7F5R416_AGRPL|nr:protein lifeguard 3-like isoform X2 [Agrilus planipennis]